jgi:ankyrin repeat protein
VAFDLRVDDENPPRLLVEFIGLSDLCTAAQMRPPLRDGWADYARVTPGKARIVESVVEVHGADGAGNSTLSDAVAAGQMSLVDELLRAGADVNASNRSGGTTLMTAVTSRNADVLRRVLAAGARLNAQDDRGQTALMWAARMANPEMAEMLIAAGADVRVRDDLGRNAATWVPDNDRPDAQRLREQFDRADPAAGRK